MLSIRQDSFEANIRAFLALSPEHHKEAWQYSDRLELDVQIDTYVHLERQGNLVFVAVKDDGALVGYYMGALNYCLHHKTHAICTTAFFYIDKQHRKGWTSVKLFSAVEALLRSKGIKQWDISYTTKKHLGSLMKRIGAEEQEIVCRKWLGD